MAKQSFEDELMSMSDEQLLSQFSGALDSTLLNLLLAEQKRRFNEQTQLKLKSANRISKWALGIASVSMIIAVISMLQTAIK